MNRTQGGQGPARGAATIRPPDTGDLAALGGFFAGLSMRSRVQRFFAPVRLSPAMIRRACGLGADGPATDGPAADGPAGGISHAGPGRPSRSGGTDAVVATVGGVIIGHGMAVDRPADRSAGRPAPLEGRVTEIGVVVADAWQGQGVGSALVRALISRAQARGVTSLVMDVLPDNRQMLAMIATHWPAARSWRRADCVTFQAALIPEQRAVPPPAAAPAGRRLLPSA
jgi:GNAT superfamily N-acetyltransferase